MATFTVRRASDADRPRALEIWRSAVDATHGFLSADHRCEIDQMVRDHFVPTAEIWLAVDGDDHAAGWLVMDGDMIDALFVDPSVHGQGIGTLLVNHAETLARGPLAVEASEQADNALPFYLARGFRVTGRKPTDPQGRPYPLVTLVRD